MPGLVAAQEQAGSDDRPAEAGERRFTLDSRLLEVLLRPLSLLRADNRLSFHTASLRIDEFLGPSLLTGTGSCIDRLPSGDGFGPAIVTDHAALRENRAAFIARLREIGFYSDRSDAYLTQTITPRYSIKALA